MDPNVRALIDAPLASATKINLPKGRKPSTAPRADPALAKAARERRDATITAKQEQLLDYYATTTVPAERVAEHVGFLHQVQTGTTDKGKPIFRRVADVGRTEAALKFRRAAASEDS